MTFESVLYEVVGQVAVITLNRPHRMNTLGGSLKADLGRALFELARQDEAVRAVVLTGSGDRAFCAGADIKEQSSRRSTNAEFFFAQKATHDLFRSIAEFEKPVIGAINGAAVGGGLELALCCDIRLTSSTARFGLPEARLGVIPAAGGTQRLPRLIGAARAKEILMTAALFDADTAFRYGIVSEVVAPSLLMTRAMTLAQQIARQPPLAVRFAKRAVDYGMQTDLESGLEFERYAAALVFDSEDRKEGMQAFIEKREPRFEGR